MLFRSTTGGEFVGAVYVSFETVKSLFKVTSACDE